MPLTALGKSLERIAGAVKIESHKLETLRQIEQHNRVIQLEAVEGGVWLLIGEIKFIDK
ncbi:MAG: hypothetical protein ACYDHG_13360 [Desulfomonilaceae bacterium]